MRSSSSAGRGARSTHGKLASGGTGAFLLLVPASDRLRGRGDCRPDPDARAARARAAARRGPISLRLAAASLARNPGHAAVAATFLVASLGLALFAVAYRSTLLRGQHDEAAYAVPASFVLTEDLTQLIPVLHGAAQSSYPVAPTRVLRLTGNVPSGATFGFLGIPADRLADGRRLARRLRAPAARRARFEPRTGSFDGARTSRRFRPASASRCVASARGDDVVDSRHLPLAARRLRERAARAHERREAGRIARAHSLQRCIPGADPARHPEQRPADGERRHGHPAECERHRHVHLATGRRRRRSRMPSAGGSAPAASSGGAARLGYVLTPDRFGRFRPSQPTDGLVLPRARDRRCRRTGGTERHHPARTRGRADRRPHRRPAVGASRRSSATPSSPTRQTAATLLDTRSPGLGTTDELWLNVAPGDEPATARLLARPPFTQLTVQSQAATLAELQADPLGARRADHARGDRRRRARCSRCSACCSPSSPTCRDERGELFDLEAQGAAPVDDPRAPAAARAARRGVRDPRRPRPRRDPLGARHLARLRDRRRRRAGAAAAARARRAAACRGGGSATPCCRGAARRLATALARARSGARGGGGRVSAIELSDVFRVHSTPEGDAAALAGALAARRRTARS